MRVVGMVRRIRSVLIEALVFSVAMLAVAPTALGNRPHGSAMRVIELQREGSQGAFRSHTIFALVGGRIEYEIRVRNTGSTTLKLRLHDPLCDRGTVSGPAQIVPRLSGDVLLPGGEAQYSCAHVLTHPDASPFVNTATVTGRPPSGRAVSATSSLAARKQATGRAIKLVRCASAKRNATGKRHRETFTVCAARKHRHAASKHRHGRRRRHRRAAFTG